MSLPDAEREWLTGTDPNPMIGYATLLWAHRQEYANTRMDIWRALPRYARSYRHETAYLAQMLRCIFGNPWRPTTPFVHEWRSNTVMDLARVCADGDWSALPALHDALLDAGCTDEALLDHVNDIALCPNHPNPCGFPGCENGKYKHDHGHTPHCWVLHLLLGTTPS